MNLYQTRIFYSLIENDIKNMRYTYIIQLQIVDQIYLNYLNNMKAWKTWLSVGIL